MSEVIDKLKETKCLALVFETFREETPKAVRQAIKETYENINQAIAIYEKEPDLKRRPATKVEVELATSLCKWQDKHRDLQAENKRLREVIRNVPTDEYGRAEMSGCDSCGAWDCFLEELAKWEEQALKGGGQTKDGASLEKSEQGSVLPPDFLKGEENEWRRR